MIYNLAEGDPQLLPSHTTDIRSA